MYNEEERREKREERIAIFIFILRHIPQ